MKITTFFLGNTMSGWPGSLTPYLRLYPSCVKYRRPQRHSPEAKARSGLVRPRLLTMALTPLRRGHHVHGLCPISLYPCAPRHFQPSGVKSSGVVYYSVPRTELELYSLNAL